MADNYPDRAAIVEGHLSCGRAHSGLDILAAELSHEDVGDNEVSAAKTRSECRAPSPSRAEDGLEEAPCQDMLRGLHRAGS
jgi:hypothetical protein